jgi:hypothetical protein
MTFDEMLTKVTEIFPCADAQEDNDGQLVIYTGMRVVNGNGEGGGEVVDFPEEESDNG